MRIKNDLSGLTATEREEYRKRRQREYSRRYRERHQARWIRAQIDSLTRKLAELEAAGGGAN